MPDPVLDVVAREPEEPHVAEEVADPAVEEHGGQEREVGSGAAMQDGAGGSPLPQADYACRHDAIGLDELAELFGAEAERRFVEEDEDVRGDYGHGHQGEGA